MADEYERINFKLNFIHEKSNFMGERAEEHDATCAAALSDFCGNRLQGNH